MKAFRHVDRDRGDVVRRAVVVTQMLDEAGDVVGAGALADVHDLAGVGIGYEREIAVAFGVGRVSNTNGFFRDRKVVLRS